MSNRVLILGLMLSAAVACTDEGDCFSPTQNLSTAYDEGAEGCACNPSRDEAMCVEGVGLLCEEGRWNAVIDGPCFPPAPAIDAGSDSAAGDAGEQPDAKVDSCDASQVAFREFVDSHRDCTVDSDCAIIGDCGPHANFEAVRADVAKQARALQLATCGGAWDGPEFAAVCLDKRCTREVLTGPGFGCPPTVWDDAGVDDAGP